MKLKLLLRKYLGIEDDVINTRNEMLYAFKRLEEQINELDNSGLNSKIDEVAYRLDYFDDYDLEEMYSNIAFLLSKYESFESAVTAQYNTHSDEISELKLSILNNCASIDNVSNSIQIDTPNNTNIESLINDEFAKYTIAVAASLRKIE